MKKKDDGYKDKEEELKAEVKALKAQVTHLQAAVGQKEARVQEEKKHLQAQLDIANNNLRKLEHDHQQGLSETNSRLHKLKKQVLLKDQELAKLRAEKLSNSKEKTEVDGLEERKGNLIDGNRVAKMLRHKDKLMSSELQQIKQHREELVGFYTEKMQLLKGDVTQLREQMTELNNIKSNKEEQLISELGKLRVAYNKLMENSQKKESCIEGELDLNRSHMKKAQSQYEQKESFYIREAALYVQDIARLTGLNTKYHSQQGANSSIIQELREELLHAYTLLKQKDEQVCNLRELYLNSKHSERKSITRTISSVQSLLQDVTKQQQLLMKDENNYSVSLRELEQIASEKERSQAQTIMDLSEQIEALRKEHQLYLDRNWELQVQKLSQENMHLLQECEYAETNITNYNMTIQALEEIIQTRNVNNEEFQLSDLVKSLQFEVEKLNVENRSLVETRNSIEKYYINEIKKLKDFLDKKNQQLEQTYCKADRARAGKAKKQVDEIASWQARQAAFTRNIKTLELKVKALTSQNDSRERISEYEKSLENKELQLLRTEITSKEEWNEDLRQSWDSQKAELLQEIDRLRTKITNSTQLHEDKLALLDEEHEILASHREQLILSIENVNSKIERMSNNTALATKYDDNKQKIFEDSHNELVQLGQEEAESLRTQLVRERELHQRELELLSNSALAENSKLREIEEVLNKHIQSQQEENWQLIRTIDDQKQQHADDLEVLRCELNSLKKTNLRKIETMNTEKDSLNFQISRLMSIIHRKEISPVFKEKLLIIDHFFEMENYGKPLENNEGDKMLVAGQEAKILLELEEDREKQYSSEKEAMKLTLQKIHESAQLFHDTALGDSHPSSSPEKESRTLKIDSTQKPRHIASKSNSFIKSRSKFLKKVKH